MGAAIMDANDTILVPINTKIHTIKAKMVAPTPHATPFPLLNFKKTDQSLPIITAVAHNKATRGDTSPNHTARYPFALSQIKTISAGNIPNSLYALVAPIFPLPRVRKSIP